MNVEIQIWPRTVQTELTLQSLPQSLDGHQTDTKRTDARNSSDFIFCAMLYVALHRKIYLMGLSYATDVHAMPLCMNCSYCTFIVSA